VPDAEQVQKREHLIPLDGVWQQLAGEEYRQQCDLWGPHQHLRDWVVGAGTYARHVAWVDSTAYTTVVKCGEYRGAD
jgi:hypothetical protein